MAIKIGINGLGRIGRCVVRALFESNYHDIELVAINSPASLETQIHLLTYDSVHGYFAAVKPVDNNMEIAGKTVRITHEKQPENINWGEVGAEIVLECTGVFKKRKDAAHHINGTVQKVLISAPSPDADSTIVYGVNNADLQPNHQVVSVGSCTTNCLAPIAKLLHENFGLETGFMTTIHAYTGDQNIVDSTHKDLRRARAAALSMVPTSTGAAKAIGIVLPELAGKLDGTAIRVPTPNVSLVDLCFTTKQHITADDINNIMEMAAAGDMSEILAINKLPLVSTDFNHNPASSIFDVTATKVMGTNFARIASWYDNEWGFSHRMLDVTRLLAKN